VLAFLDLSTVRFKKIHLSPKVMFLPRGIFSQIMDTEKFCHTTSTVADCDKPPTIVGLLLTTFGGGGRGQMLSTVD